jgi:polyisoprenoid-binding protein YceI
MRKNTKFLFVALAGLMISSCAGEIESKDTAEIDVKKAETCLYSYSAESSELKFTAYKFLGKTGVGGAFTEIKVEGGEENESDLKVIEELSFEIPVTSVSTNNEDRDGKIQEHFFGQINTATITGEVVSIEEGGKSAILMITMNGVSNEVRGDYTLSDGAFTYDTEINVFDWQAEKGIEKLNEVCKDLHTDYANGDTESKLWPDVTLSFTTQLKKNCN